MKNNPWITKSRPGPFVLFPLNATHGAACFSLPVHGTVEPQTAVGRGDTWRHASHEPDRLSAKAPGIIDAQEAATRVAAMADVNLFCPLCLLQETLGLFSWCCNDAVCVFPLLWGNRKKPLPFELFVQLTIIHAKECVYKHLSY